MKNNCLCCGKEIPTGMFQLSSCMDCIKAGCTGVALYTVDGSARWCNVHNKASCPTEREFDLQKENVCNTSLT